jgi:hypothetical protein
MDSALKNSTGLYTSRPEHRFSVGLWTVGNESGGGTGCKYICYRSVKDYARGCMRTYLILGKKAARWNADQEMQALLQEISGNGAGAPREGQGSKPGAAALLAHVLDKDAICRKRLSYERLGQLTVDVLLGTR